jgi:hypothetical protein
MTGLKTVLGLAERGWYVFPVDDPTLLQCAGTGRDHDPATCTDRGKHPCVAWATKATDDPKELAAYFAGFPRNVGIVCGPSRLVVVDEDKPGGFETYAASIGQAIPATYTVQIGKGRHFYFGATDHPELGNAPGLPKEYGCDVRGAGGYVVGIGSLHASGALYEVSATAQCSRRPGGWSTRSPRWVWAHCGT